MKTLDLQIVDGRIERMGQDLSPPASQVIDLKGKVVATGLPRHARALPGAGIRTQGDNRQRDAPPPPPEASPPWPACRTPNLPSTKSRSSGSSRQKPARRSTDWWMSTPSVRSRGQKRRASRPACGTRGGGSCRFLRRRGSGLRCRIMRRALEYSAMFNRPVIQHAQDPPLSKGGVANEGFVATALGLPVIPRVAEEIMVMRDIRLAEYTGGRVSCRPCKHGGNR